MSDLALAAAGVIVFALTTWASLAFGYQVFQNMYESDNPDDVISDPSTTGERLAPIPAVVATVDEVSPSAEFVLPASPAA